MLELNNVTKKFGSLTAVNKLSFTIKPGEIVGLIGPNGSGKTSTIKMIAGLYEPTSGSIRIKAFDAVKEKEKTRCAIGYIPDEPAAYDKLTGDEFLNFVGDAYAIPPQKRQQAIAQMKKIYPMPEQTGGYFEDYSRGTRQKFMIMAALLHNPSLLLVDEPIVGLDPLSAEKTIELFSDYVKDKEHSILISTHTLPVAQKICNRFIVLEHGQKIADATLAELKHLSHASGSLEEVYLKLIHTKKVAHVVS